jgi:hydroxyethylthiazole kinase-like uncharacterized protein yjeF
MERAGSAAAEVLLRVFSEQARSGVAVLVGPGNNGGDGWVLARRLVERGIAVRVQEVAGTRSADALENRRRALSLVSLGAPQGNEGVVVDALLGTGARGKPSGAVAEAVQCIEALRKPGRVIVALDVPTGVDATSGDTGLSVKADLTVTFGTMKRGLLLARGRAGCIVVADIGLGEHAHLADGAPLLVDEDWVAARIPPIPWQAHKGTRRKLVIVGGRRGMAGAAVLAARAAERSGVGMVRLMVAEESLGSVQAAIPEATALSWVATAEQWQEGVSAYADALLLGPGLGVDRTSRAVLERALAEWCGPVVLDADALNAFAGKVEELRQWTQGRAALLTPHPGELSRLAGRSVSDIEEARFEIGREVARVTSATVLLKGVPTVISSPDGECYVAARGTAALAVAGSGDVLGGIAATLLAQTGDAVASAVCAAWVHGRAAELAGAGRPLRGVTLGDVLEQLGYVWAFSGNRPLAPVLMELPAVGDA